MEFNLKVFRLPHFFYFCILSIIGIILLKPLLTFQPFLSQGDHGLNLYAAQAVDQGAIPYRDFSWFYGPLMPYYYATFLKFFGISIQSLLYGKAFLIFISGFLLYRNLNFVASRFLSAVGAIWFWIFYRDFPYTFNHTAGIPLLLLIAYFTFSFLKNQNIKFLYLNLCLILLLALVKINFGFSTLAAVLTIIVINGFCRRKHPFAFYFLAIIPLPAIILFIYWLFLHDLPSYYLQQLFPYLSYAHSVVSVKEHHQSMGLNLIVDGYLIIKNILSSWPNIAFAAIILLSGLKSLIDWKQKQHPLKEFPIEFLIVFSLLIFYIASMHEFLILSVFYQAYWGDPFKVLMMFGVIGLAWRAINPKIEIIIAGTIFLLALFQAPREYTLLTQFRNPRTQFHIHNTRIEIGNDPQWGSTVLQTTQYLETHLKKNESFWAVPYDPLYYFLTHTLSPTKELMVLNIGITHEQELAIIKELNTKNVNWIVMSNRGNEPGIRALSDRYCPTIVKFIDENFTVQAQFGNWDSEPHWWTNHGIKIFKRTIPIHH